MLRLSRLNHAVLFVRDLERSVAFYRDVLGLTPVARMGDDMAFLRAPGSPNHHDLGLAAVGTGAPSPARGSVGLYHLAWEVAAIEDIAEAHAALAGANALGGASDHGTTKSLYGRDPDGNEFEIMWPVPRAAWGPSDATTAVTRRLDLAAELERFGAGDRRRRRAANAGMHADTPYGAEI